MADGPVPYRTLWIHSTIPTNIPTSTESSKLIRTITMQIFTIVAVLAAAASAASVSRQPGPVNCSTCNLDGSGRACHPSAACTLNGGAGAPNKAYCTCPSGFKANPREVGADPAAQWRLNWAGHESQVFVRWETACTTPCNDATCSEISINRNPQCFA
ncbi:hypothetical protein EJ05DRAFT_104278 [Pseudovirgaria hyperparasitica]|uniref:Uncharacterized protein n=1 Tax=Pseudovirgaria hyperparasitica TaxID=470096 RepID=A0A6A6W398_9PEZI|nr:uncharacterized protein EJ05DRAFT_104278 [Pseudovirgaria hyperparasitica]KAF2755511.1 hypothetical protein EJ05DRAFT_104278 [Pseudovirgaria hyperparasitica]